MPHRCLCLLPPRVRTPKWPKSSIYDRKINCYHCGSEQTPKHGKTGNGKRRYGCSACRRSFRENPEASGYTETAKGQILRAYQERSSLRGLTRMLGVSRNTVTALPN